MSVDNTDNRTPRLAANGVKVAFDFAFKIFAKDQIDVYDFDANGVATLKVLDVDYSVIFDSDEETGTFTFFVAPLDTHEVQAIRNVPYTQLANIPTEGGVPEDVITAMVDKVAILCQQLLDELTKAIKLPTTSEEENLVFPDLEAGFLTSDGATMSWSSLTATQYNGSILAGADASKPATPDVNDIYIATDTEIVYVCYSNNVWTKKSTMLQDADKDTAVEVERTPDEDIIHNKVLGTDELDISFSGISLKTGTSVNEISTDDTLAGDSDDVLVTEKAIKAAIDDQTVTDYTEDAAVDLSTKGWFLDEDDMVSDDPLKVASQQSIKKYVDDNLLADGSVSQVKLKTSIGEVSVNTSGLASTVGVSAAMHIEADGTTLQQGAVLGGAYATLITLGANDGLGGGVDADLTLPGGTYGFYPQLKYVAGTRFVHAQQRYVTASGTDHWFFLLLERGTHKIIATYQAPDHPCYGNGGDYDERQHPFLNYDPLIHDIVILDKSTIRDIKTQAVQKAKEKLLLRFKGKYINHEEIIESFLASSTKIQNGLNHYIQAIQSCLSLTDTFYEDFDFTAEEQVYEPLHTGLFKGTKKVKIDKLPDFIKVVNAKIK